MKSLEITDVDRLKRAINFLKKNRLVKTQADIASDLGYKRAQTISDYLLGKVAITPRFIKTFLSRYKLEQDWWDKNEWPTTPETTLDVVSEVAANSDIIRNPLLKRAAKGAGDVPFYDADFVAGNGISFFEDNVSKPAYTMQIPGYAGCVAFPAYGDSMESLIRSGSVLFGRKLEDWRSYLEYGQIYGIVMKDERRFLKYIRRSSTHEKTFLLRSENEKYDDFEIPIEKVHNIWLIEGWMLKRT